LIEEQKCVKQVLAEKMSQAKEPAAKKGKKKQGNKAELAKEVSSLVTVHSLAVSHTRLQNLIVANHISGVEDPVTAARNTLAAEYPEMSVGVETVLAAARAGLTVAEVVASSGKECSLPGSCLGGLASVLLAPDLVTAVRLNILAGGDCCSRANFIGAVFGTRDSIEAMQVEWMEKVFASLIYHHVTSIPSCRYSFKS